MVDRQVYLNAEAVTAADVGGTSVAALSSLKGVAGLPTEVHPADPLAVAVAHLEKRPEEVGVLVTDGPRVIQVLSREWTAELLAKPYCRELFLHKPLSHLLRLYSIVPLELAETTAIPEAIERALSRPSAARYQPLIVATEQGTRWLLDVYSLLLKQCRVLSSTLHDLEEQRRATQSAQAERERLQQRLLDASREAGRAEVATGILHNVGNVLNSITVSAAVINRTLQQSKVGNLVKSVAMLEQHREDLAAFLTGDERGRRLAPYLVKIADVLFQEHARAVEEVASLNERLEHVRRVVAMQQSYARSSTVREMVLPADLMEDAIRVNLASFERHNIIVERQYAASSVVSLDKHKVLQILINLVSNAKNAVKHRGAGDKRITCAIEAIAGDEADQIRFRVTDNGVGIPAENLTRIFTQGFTTRKDGHGFGLHSAVNAAREMGGSLIAASDGRDAGAVFTLDLPLSAEGNGADSLEAHGSAIPGKAAA